MSSVYASRRFALREPPTVSPAESREELGPCSLDPAALFGARLPSLFEARRRLPTSATTIDVRATKPELLDPRREGGLDLHPFLACQAVFATLVGEGAHTRRAALRPFVMAPVLVPPTCVGLPNRDATSTAPPPGLAPWCIVRIDVYGSKDRAKDASRAHTRSARVVFGVHAFFMGVY